MSMFRSLKLLALALLWLLPVSASAADVVLATLGKASLHLAEVRSAMAQLPAPKQTAVKADAKRFEEFVRELVVRKYFIRQAHQERLDREALTKFRIDSARDHVLYTAYLQAVSTPAAAYPSPQQLQQAYQSAKPQLKTESQYHLRQIYIADKGDAKAAKKKAYRLYAQLKRKPALFEKLVSRFSDYAPSKARKGDMGWISDSKLLPEIKKLLGAAPKPGIRKPLVRKGGVHLLELVAYRPTGFLSLQQATPLLRQQLRQQAQLVLEKQYLQRLVAEQKISYSKKYWLVKTTFKDKKPLRHYRSRMKTELAQDQLGNKVMLRELLMWRENALRNGEEITTANGLKRSVIPNILIKKRVLAAARKQGWHKRPDVVLRVKQAGMAVLVDRWMEKHVVLPKGYPLDAEVARMYQDNIKRFITPEKVHLAQIFVFGSAEPTQLKANKALVERTLSLLARHSNRFDAEGKRLVARYPKVVEMADLGWHAVASLAPDIASAVNGLKRGHVAGTAIITSRGWRLLRLLDRQPTTTQPLAVVKAQLMDAMRTKQRVQMRQVRLRSLVSGSDIHVVGRYVQQAWERLR